MSVDKAIQIRSILSRKKDKIKSQKKFRSVCFAATLALCCAVYVLSYANDTVTTYNEKNEVLSNDQQEVEMAKQQIEEEKLQIVEQQEELALTAEMLAKNNQSIIEENMRLQDTLKIAASVGITPQNYNDADPADTAIDYTKLEYIGEFEGTAYTPSPEECSNSLGYTASGKPIVAGVSIAVDTSYWKLGTEFYIEGLGYVVAMDTGSAVKGKYRFDYAVFDRSFALKLGRRNWKVYKVISE
ncbi:MAG: 3D domain-containing protein [Clostridia bacterium]|nr:3D domain-containing protein [Clostridia bacterium]